MTATASKFEEKRLDWSVQTGASQTESQAKPVAEASNRIQFARQTPEPPLSVPRRLDLCAKQQQYQRKGILLGECRLGTIKMDLGANDSNLPGPIA